MRLAAIFGAGRMGTAIGYAMKTLGYRVAAIDNNIDNISNFMKLNGDCDTHSSWNDMATKPDVVISSLPYHATAAAADWAIDKGIRYCDLGGAVSVSEVIKAKAMHGKMPVMTDLGLAPGWINLMAEELFESLGGADSIKMMVGGIPEDRDPNDALDYMVTWSVDGLLNEYQDDCTVLVDGEMCLTPGMSMCENVTVGDMELEAFCTSGASAHTIPLMQKRGVKNVVYKTLRWRGHRRYMAHLLRTLDREAVEKVLAYSSTFHERDIVVMQVVATKGHTSLTKTQVIHRSQKFTAMQRSTAFAISSVAACIGHGDLDGINYPGYADIPMDFVNKNLALLLASDI